MAYYGYARVSTKGQKDTSLEVQLEYLRIQARELKEKFIPMKEKASGKSISDREVFTYLLNKVQKGDIIGVYDQSRFGRNTAEALSTARGLNDKGVRIHINGQFYDPTSPDAEFMFTINSAIATRERKVILSKAKASMNVKRKNGDFIFIGTLFGYNLESRGKNVNVTINEEEAYYVRYIFNEVANGRSIKAVVDELADVHPSGRNLDYKTVLYMLKRPIYTGKYFLDADDTKMISVMDRENLSKRLIRSNHYQAIIDDDTFWRVQENWNHLPRVKDDEYGYRRTKSELSGILRCPQCGFGIAHSYYHDRYGNKRSGMYCLSYHKRGCTAKKKSIRESVALYCVRLALYLTLSSPDETMRFFESEKVLIEQSEEQLESQIAHAKAMIEELDNEMRNIKNSIKSGILTIEDFADDIKQNKEERRKYEDEISAMSNAHMGNGDRYRELLEISSFKMMSQYNMRDDIGRREILTTLIEKGVLEEDNWTVEFKNGKRFVFSYMRGKGEKPFGFKMYLGDEFQDSGMIDIRNGRVTFDGRGTVLFFHDDADDIIITQQIVGR